MTSYKHLTIDELLTYAQSDWSTPLEHALLVACLNLKEAVHECDDCEDSYDRGYEDGKEEGYDDGYEDGIRDGKLNNEQD